MQFKVHKLSLSGPMIYAITVLKQRILFNPSRSEPHYQDQVSSKETNLALRLLISSSFLNSK